MKKVTLDDIKIMAKMDKGEINTIFIQWFLGNLGEYNPDFHINIDRKGDIYTNVLGLAEILPHTDHYNNGAVGIAILLESNENFGGKSPTNEQVESLIRVTATLCSELEIPCDFEHVRTHEEQAKFEKKELEISYECIDGNVIRKKVNWYLQNKNVH